MKVDDEVANGMPSNPKKRKFEEDLPIGPLRKQTKTEQGKKSRSKATKEPDIQPVDGARKRKAANGMDPASKRKRGDEQELTPKESGKPVQTKLIPPL